MNIVPIVLASLCLSWSLAGSTNFPNWIDSLVKYVVEDTTIRRVALITSLQENERIASPRFEEITIKLMQKLPTVRINIDSIDAIDNSSPEEPFDRPDPGIDTSPTFFLLAHESLENLPISSSKKIVDSLATISTFNQRSKHMIVLFDRVYVDGIEELLRYAWTKRLLDLTIVQLVEPETIRKSLISHATPILHSLNPFKKEYTRIEWSPRTPWFPEKLDNGWGHPLKVTVSDSPPFSIVDLNEQGALMKVGGPSVVVLKNVAQRLNLTVKYKNSWIRPNNNSKSAINDLYRRMTNKQTDFVTRLMPHYSNSLLDRSFLTSPILIDELCFIVPIFRTPVLMFSTNFFKGCLLYFGIITFFWFLGRIFRFQGHTWEPFNLARLLFGITVVKQPAKNHERMLFSCLLAVSIIFSSTIYSEITDLTLSSEVETKFDSYDDLDRSGLTPIVKTILFDKIFGDANGPLLNLKNKAIKYKSPDVFECARRVARYKNVTCIFRKQLAKIAVKKINRNGDPVIKIAEVRLGAEPWAFGIMQRSPYRSRMDEILGEMRSAGLLLKWYEHEYVTRDELHDEEKSVTNRNPSMIPLRRQLLIIIGVGYTLSLLAFIGEIVVYRVSKYKKSKTRPTQSTMINSRRLIKKDNKKQLISSIKGSN